MHTVSGYLVLGMAVLSLVVLSGWSGSVSLGQYAIVGVGAVVAGDLLVKLNIDLFFVLLLAAAGGAVVSALVGLPALRVRPLFLAVTSLMFAAAMDQYFLNPSNYPDWIPSTVVRPVLFKRFPLDSENTIYYLCLARARGQRGPGGPAAASPSRAGAAGRAGQHLRGRGDDDRRHEGAGGRDGRGRRRGGPGRGSTAVLQSGVGGSSLPAADQRAALLDGRRRWPIGR